MIKVVDRKLIQMEAKYELARRKFFFYCNLKAPKFYKQNRKYLVDLCNTFQEFYEGTDDVLIINNGDCLYSFTLLIFCITKHIC